MVSVLYFSYIKLKNQNKNFRADSNILESPKAGRGDRSPYPASPEDEYKNKKIENCQFGGSKGI